MLHAFVTSSSRSHHRTKAAPLIQKKTKHQTRKKWVIPRLLLRLVLQMTRQAGPRKCPLLARGYCMEGSCTAERWKVWTHHGHRSLYCRHNQTSWPVDIAHINLSLLDCTRNITIILHARIFKKCHAGFRAVCRYAVRQHLFDFSLCNRNVACSKEGIRFRDGIPLFESMKPCRTSNCSLL